MRILIVTGGHPFETEPFFSVFDDMHIDGISVQWDHVAHPEAQRVLNVADTANYDALVMYDMPGITFTGGNPPAEFTAPSEAFQRGYLELLDAGRGLVFLHHAIASWPAWPEFSTIVGGRFLYQPGEVDGQAWPDSGYVFDVTHTVEVLEPEHPICAGLEPSFDIIDELYLFPVLEDQIVPLMRSRFKFVDTNFSSADLAIRGVRDSRDGWNHPAGSDLVAWVKHARNSPLAYIQFADGPVTYADANYRRVLANAVSWAASDKAHEWARARRNAEM